MDTAERAAQGARATPTRTGGRLVTESGEVHALCRELLRGEEEERRRLARELHDELGQYLTALGLGLQALSDVAPPGSEIDRRAAKLRELTSTLGRQLHALAVRLWPSVLDDFGLEAAIAAHAEEWSARTGIGVDVHARAEAERLPGAVESALYRILQEALAEVATHGRATHASVVVERRGGQVLAVVEDDGRVLEGAASAGDDDDGAPRASSGPRLLGIRERAVLAGGAVDVERAPGGGTVLFVRIPIDVAGRGARPGRDVPALDEEPDVHDDG